MLYQSKFKDCGDAYRCIKLINAYQAGKCCLTYSGGFWNVKIKGEK